ncbi:uncharacterized protein BDW43DRAFT_314571 [Aspergillus alliaceus]|uniref:uncharacterized protein n=1 Tax=Petromyces alliaceus TaxID=209559 RepID=UPI0012A627C9|nr:uncharacterized protein BDW43DRAFT_314571 [Aspergillus alliaceus]KAB8229926.1 hypothetical protein BDW43DRAFT_314571 [Aspergillus alliaceus]
MNSPRPVGHGQVIRPFRERSFHLADSLVITFVGYLILVTVDAEVNQGVAHFACSLLAAGAFVPISIFTDGIQITNESQRAVTVGFLVGSANCAGIPSSLSFTADTAPKYLPALIVDCDSSWSGWWLFLV